MSDPTSSEVSNFLVAEGFEPSAVNTGYASLGWCYQVFPYKQKGAYQRYAPTETFMNGS
jgi:hypothetical protein